MKLISYILGAMVLILPMAVWAAYNDVSLTTGTTLTLTVGGSTLDLTVNSGTIEAIRVQDSDLSMDLAAGSSIDLNSADKFTFTYNKANTTASFTCGSSSSVLNLSLGQGQATETVVVTPIRTACVAAGSGSGGGSTPSTPSTTTTTSTPSPTTTTTTTTSAPSAAAPSASTAAKPAVAPAPTSSPAPAPSAPAVSAPAPVVSMVPVLMKEINPGARSDEVMKLQELLAQDPTIYPDGTVSGFYGPKTTAAVKKFQAKYGLPTVGRVGPATLAKLNDVFGPKAEVVSAPALSTSVQSQTANQIQSQIQAIQQQIQTLTGGAVSTPSAPAVTGGFTVALSLGTRNEDVRSLQQVLNSDSDTQVSASGLGSAGSETNYFGPATQTAVQRFQVKYGIAGPGDPGYGFVGPATRAKLNELSGEATSAPAPSYTAPVTPTTPTSSSNTAKQIEEQIKAIQAQINALLKK